MITESDCCHSAGDKNSDRHESHLEDMLDSMDLNKPLESMTPADRRVVEKNLAHARPFGSLRGIWVEDGHVFVEREDGEIVFMTPAAAIDTGRKLSDAAADALINQVMDDSGSSARQNVGD